ncbi:unnamed protein product [Prunus armeniaca]
MPQKTQNSFTGYVPSSICLQHSSPFLRLLDFSSNLLNGDLAPGLGKCSELQVFRAGHNNLLGLFPEDIYKATKHEEIALPLNSLHGAISDKIVNLANLAILDLSFNHFGHKLPINLGKLSKLKFVTFDFNNLVGVTKMLMSCKSLHTLLLGGSFVGEGMPSDDDMVDFDGFQNLQFLSWLILTSLVKYLGYIPAEISQLQLLRHLVLGSNNFAGIIPDQISDLQNLEILDLSMNHLSGIIPSSLARLNFLKEFNALYNNLEGPIPTGTQLQSFNAFTFEENPKLCGAPLPNKCGPSKGIDTDNKNNKDMDNRLHQLPWAKFHIVLKTIDWSTSQLSLVYERATASNENPSRLL